MWWRVSARNAHLGLTASCSSTDNGLAACKEDLASHFPHESNYKTGYLHRLAGLNSSFCCRFDGLVVGYEAVLRQIRCPRVGGWRQPEMAREVEPIILLDRK